MAWEASSAEGKTYYCDMGVWGQGRCGSQEFKLRYVKGKVQVSCVSCASKVPSSIVMRGPPKPKKVTKPKKKDLLKPDRKKLPKVPKGARHVG